jgi:DNA-binding response OmpR family regulator
MVQDDRANSGRESEFRNGAPPDDAKSPRVLAVEDEFLLACSLEDDLRSFGYAVVGPFANLARASEAAARERFDLAVLDVNLNGEMVFPLVEALMERGIPLLLLSGYGNAGLPERFRALPRLAKPYDPKLLERELKKMVPAAE